MADQIPPTQKGQIDALFSALGVSDFTGATAAINSLKAASGQEAGWQSERAALFAALGGTGEVPEHYDFAANITALKTGWSELLNKLGVPDQAGAVLALDNLRTENNNLKAVQTSIFGALKATDHAGAMRAINDIDGRIEAGIQAGLVTRAASAGLPAPVTKPPGGEGGAAANTVTRAQFASMNAKQQSDFVKAGGKITDEVAA